ncbi:phosphopentomutase/phosphoglucosamine mutase [Halorussus salinus]|uniref:phosphopentomutase/phosphoglucosamine mutase n=1 Tax=Halorussus salinus TaxID=1364935 RepID=UPI001091F055|nr:phosphopentomutase/phosphoglucosamine mutase [Halorussus salinus]
MFGTSGVRGEVGGKVTAQLAFDVGRALASEGYERVVVGRDARESGQLLADAVSAGLRDCGADAVRAGVVATPTLARSVWQVDCDAGVEVTASHNPPTDNGLKLWDVTSRAFDRPKLDAVADRVGDGRFTPRSSSELGSEIAAPDLEANHRDALREATDLGGADGLGDGDGLDGEEGRDGANLSVVVDAGNGPGVLTADALRDLGCSVTTLNGERDGRLSGRPSEPTADHCADLRAIVARGDADFGVAHDGDADRTMAVTEDGEFVAGDVLLALFGRRYAEEGTRVAAPLNTSLAVDDALESVGASLTRTRVGDGYVADRLRDEGVVFGGEPSGAWIWPDEAHCPDGPLAACRLAELVAEEGPLSELVETVATYPTKRTSVRTDDKRGTMAGVADALADRHDELDTRDGVRVEVEDGWLLVRASGTQPLVRVTAEAETDDRASELFDEAVALVERVEGDERSASATSGATGR